MLYIKTSPVTVLTLTIAFKQPSDAKLCACQYLQVVQPLFTVASKHALAGTSVSRVDCLPVSWPLAC